MVGVPRSKGCRTCVQRKVKCDQTRPNCGNCIKGNRTCLGYGQDAKFQDEGPRLREKYKAQSPPTSDHEAQSKLCWVSTTTKSKRLMPPDHEQIPWSATALDIDGPEKITLLSFVEGKTGVYKSLGLADHATPGRENGALFARSMELATECNLTSVQPALLSPFLMQDQLFQGFRDSVAPFRQDFLPAAMKSYATWLNHLPEFTGTDLLLDTAVRAVTLVHIGRLHNSEVCISESRPFYGRALRLLNKAIMDKETGMSNMTLCATMLLSFYEMFASDNDASWVRHAGGASTLMRMRGPERHRKGFDREIFLSYRHTLIIEAFSNDTPSFLNEPIWRQLSRDIHQDIRNENLIPSDRLEMFEVVEQYNQQLAELTQLGSEAYHLYHPVHGQAPEPTHDWLVAYTNLKDSQKVMRRIFSALRAALSKLDLLPQSVQTKDPVMPINYTYPNVFISVKCVGYWTTQMVCNLHLLLLGARLIKVIPAMKQDLVAVEEECMDFSLECCRSVNYMLRSSFLGPFFAVYAMRLASRSFPPGGPQWEWTIGKLYQIGERHMLFAKHIPRFDNYGNYSELRDTALRIKKKLVEARGETIMAERIQFEERYAVSADIEPTSGQLEPHPE